jgi:hypothetical protein
MFSEFIPVVSGLVLCCVARPVTHKWRIISAILAGAVSSILAGEVFGTVGHALMAIVADSGIVYCVTSFWPLAKAASSH